MKAKVKEKEKTLFYCSVCKRAFETERGRNVHEALAHRPKRMKVAKKKGRQVMKRKPAPLWWVVF